MANQFYPTYKQDLMTGLNLDLTGVNLKCVLLDTNDYTADLTYGGDEFLGDIPSGARVSTTGNLTSVSVVDGVLDADDISLPDSGGDQAEALAIYYDTGTESTSRLLVYVDNATGLPLTPDNVDDTIQWAADGIAKL